MSKIFDSIKVYGSGTTNSSSTLDTYDSSGTTTFTIKDGGNVGIGTNSPTEKLFVSGKTYISESLGIGSSAPGSGISLGSTYPIYFGNANHNIYNSGDSLFVNGWSYLTLNASTAVGISTNNINRLYVNSIGNVGIGTSTPNAPLDVNGKIYSRTGGVYTDNITTYTAGNLNYNVSANSHIFNINGGEKFRIDVSGNVGIGTSTPLTTLHVNGKATIQGDVDVFGNVNVLGTATTLNTETVQTRDNKILLNYSGTNVTAVGGGISVLSANTIYTSGLTELITDINGDWNSNVGLNITGRTSDNSSNGLTVKNSGGTDNFVVRNDGNVGIGTSNPNAKLDVRGTTSSGEVLLQLYSTDWATPSERPRFTLTQGTSLIRANYQNFYASDDNGNVNVTFRGDNAIIEMYSPSFSATTFRITNSNKPLIYAPNSGLIGTTSKWLFDPNNSTNPTANVHIKGIDSSSSNYGLKVQDSGGTDNLVVRNDGNVGIGTSTPSEKVEVIGNVKVNGDLTVTGTTNISGQTSVGPTFYPNQRIFQVSQESAFMSFGSLIGSSGTTAIYFNQTTPTALNYTINSTSALTRYNASSLMDFRIVDTNKYRITSVNHEWNTSPQTSSGQQTIDYSFTPASHTSQSASTNTPNFRVLGNTRSWLGGNITNQYWNYFQRSNALFTTASTITNSYGLYVEAASASTNATITNNYAAGFQGEVYISGTTTSRRINPEADNTYPLGDSNRRWSTIYTKGLRLYESRTSGGISDDDYINFIAPSDLSLTPNPAWSFVLPLLSGVTNSFLGVYSGDSNTSNTTWFSLSGGTGISILQTSNISGGTMTLSSSPTSFYSEPSSTAVTWNVSGNSSNYKLTLTANTTLNLNNVRNGDYGTIILTQDSGGNRTVTLGTVNGAAATHKVVNGGAGLVSLTTTANAIDILSFTYDGTNMYWNKGLNYT